MAMCTVSCSLYIQIGINYSVHAACSLLEPYTVYACGQPTLSENLLSCCACAPRKYTSQRGVQYSLTLKQSPSSTTKGQTLLIHDVKTIVLIWE